MNNIYDIVSDLDLSNGATKRMDCPTCKGYKTFTATNNMGSSVCYVDYDPEVHKPTHFYAPYLNFINGSVIDHIPEGIEEGSIIFFPSAIGHCTVPHHSDKTRTILSFNLKVE